MPIVDVWGLYYNGDKGFQRVAVGERDEYLIENALLFNSFQAIKK